MEATEKKRGFFKSWKRRGLVCLLAAALLGAAFLGGLFLAGRQAEPQITAELVSQRLEAIVELATVEYHYTNMGKFENQIDFYGWKVPLTRKSFIVSYDGSIKAGVDLKALQVQVEGTQVTVTLPRAKVLSHEIDQDSLQIFDESKNLFNPLQISDYTGFTADQRMAVEERAVEKGLLTEAQGKAQEAVKALLGLAPEMESYQISVH